MFHLLFHYAFQEQCNLEFFTRALIKFVLAFMEANLYSQKPTTDKKISCLLLFLRFFSLVSKRMVTKG